MQTVPPGGKQTEVLQIRFVGGLSEEHQMSAWDLAQSLEGVTAFAEEILQASLPGEMVTEAVMVRPPQEGSFEIQLLVDMTQWVAENPEAALSISGVTGSGLIIGSIRAGIKLMRGNRPKNAQYQEHNDTYLVEWTDGNFQEVPQKAWQNLTKEKKQTKKSLQKFLEPTGKSAEAVELRSADINQTTEEIRQQPPVVTYDQTDYRAISYDTEEETTDGDTFTTEARFISVDFRPDKKWRIQSTHGTRLAWMADAEFQKQIDKGLKIGSDDLFELTIEEKLTTKSGRTRSEWTIVHVRRTKVGESKDPS